MEDKKNPKRPVLNLQSFGNFNFDIPVAAFYSMSKMDLSTGPLI